MKSVYLHFVLSLFIAGSIDVEFFDISVAFFFFPGASEARDSLSDILRGVFKFTGSRQR